jgi:S1-C subfamily serine protease
MFWKKAGLICIVLAALAIVTYGQTSGQQQRAHSTNLQMPASYLGVDTLELNAERAKALNLKDVAGLEVTRVAEDSPAARAGIHVHDVILEIGGQKVDGLDDFRASIAGKAPGTKIVLTVARNGAKQTIAATLEPRPVSLFMGMPQQGVLIPAIPMSPEDLQAMIAGDAPKVGFEGEALTPQLAEFFGVREGEGVLVRAVVEKTPAERAGLKAGDVITKVNGTPVTNPREISGIVRQSKKTIVFTVVRNKKEITLNVELACSTFGEFGNDVV